MFLILLFIIKQLARLNVFKFKSRFIEHAKIIGKSDLIKKKQTVAAKSIE